MLSAKRENHSHHFNVFGMTRPLSEIEPWNPALEASPVPLGV